MHICKCLRHTLSFMFVLYHFFTKDIVNKFLIIWKFLHFPVFVIEFGNPEIKIFIKIFIDCLAHRILLHIYIINKSYNCFNRIKKETIGSNNKRKRSLKLMKSIVEQKYFYLLLELGHSQYNVLQQKIQKSECCHKPSCTKR